MSGSLPDPEALPLYLMHNLAKQRENMSSAPRHPLNNSTGKRGQTEADFYNADVNETSIKKMIKDDKIKTGDKKQILNLDSFILAPPYSHHAGCMT